MLLYYGFSLSLRVDRTVFVYDTESLRIRQIPVSKAFGKVVGVKPTDFNMYNCQMEYDLFPRISRGSKGMLVNSSSGVCDYYMIDNRWFHIEYASFSVYVNGMRLYLGDHSIIQPILTRSGVVFMRDSSRIENMRLDNRSDFKLYSYKQACKSVLLG